MTGYSLATNLRRGCPPFPSFGTLPLYFLSSILPNTSPPPFSPNTLFSSDRCSFKNMAVITLVPSPLSHVCRSPSSLLSEARNAEQKISESFLLKMLPPPQTFPLLEIPNLHVNFRKYRQPPFRVFSLRFNYWNSLSRWAHVRSWACRLFGVELQPFSSSIQLCFQLT